jgi:hypothetical protein
MNVSVKQKFETYPKNISGLLHTKPVIIQDAGFSGN